MAADDDIFGDLTDKKVDKDIFADVPVKEEVKEPVAQNTRMMEVTSRPRQFISSETGPARMAFGAPRTRLVPEEGPIDRGIYQAGGAVTDVATHMGMPPWLAAGMGYLANVGLQTGATFLGGNVGSKTAPALEGAGKWFMRSAIKPAARDLEAGRVPAAIETMLEGGYMPTNSGIAGMKSKASELSKKVDDIIANSSGMVDVTPGVNNALGVATKVGAGTQGVQNANKVNDVVGSLYQHPNMVPGTPWMSVQDAQRMKSQNYKDIGPTGYGLGLPQQIERDTLKAINAGLRQGIEKVEPGVAPLNKDVQSLLNAIKVSQRRAMMEANKDIVPLGSAFSIATQNPLAALGMWANSNAYAKAMAARLLYSGSEAIPENLGRAIAGALAAESGSPPQGVLYQP